MVFLAANASATECAIGLKSEDFGLEAFIETCEAIGTFSIGGLYEGNYERLTFNYPSPWRGTFATFRIGGEDYCTSPNARDCILADEYIILRPNIQNREVVTKWRISQVDIIQRIGFFENKTRITYELENTGETPRQAGIRLLMDTMLGHNDGAPIYVPGDGMKTSEAVYFGSNLDYTYWKAYNHPSDPTIVAAGSLDRKTGYSVPDRFIIADWKRAKDTAWEYDIRGEQMISDSAVLYYYDMGVLDMGGSEKAVIGYGADEPVLRTDQSSMGITEILIRGPRQFWCPNDEIVFKVDALTSSESINATLGLAVVRGDRVEKNSSVSVFLEENRIKTSEFRFLVPEINESSGFDTIAWLVGPEGETDSLKRTGIFRVEPGSCRITEDKAPYSRGLFGLAALIIFAAIIGVFAFAIAYAWNNRGEVSLIKTVDGEMVRVLVSNGTKKTIKDALITDTIPANAEISVETLKVLRRSGTLLWQLGNLGPGESATLTYWSRDGLASGDCLLEWDGGKKRAD